MSNKEGYTIFQPTGITIDYTHVDLLKKQVTATLSCHHEIKMTVITDFITDQMYKDGDLSEVLAALPSEDEELYFEQIYDWSKIFIENEISDPKKYFEQFEQL